MLTISEHIINIRHSNAKDFPFILECYNSKEFNLYFDRNKLDYDRYWILSYNGSSVGVANFDSKNIFGIETILFAIYVLPARRLLSGLSIISAVSFIIENFPNADRIEFRTYSNNKVCLLLFDELGIEAECIYPDARFFDEKYWDLYCFSIYLKDDLILLKKLFHEKILNE